MPFYEYECESCKFYTELLQKVSDAPLRKCPSCGKNKMKKLVSAPVFRLKGSGWYETDFKGDKENKRNLAVDKEPDTVSESKPAKPAASSDTKAAEARPAESKGSDSKAAESKSSGSGSSEGGSSAARSRRSAASSRSTATSKARAKVPAARAPARSKAKPAARRKGR